MPRSLNAGMGGGVLPALWCGRGLVFFDGVASTQCGSIVAVGFLFRHVKMFMKNKEACRQLYWVRIWVNSGLVHVLCARRGMLCLWLRFRVGCIGLVVYFV